MWTPIEAILRGGGVSQMPVSPSIRFASRPNAASVWISASSRSRQYFLHVLPVARQVEDRVADELAGPVVRGLAAAVGLDDLDVGALGHVQLARLGASPERDHRRVLEEQHRVGQLAGADRQPRSSAAASSASAIRDEPEVHDVTRSRGSPCQRCERRTRGLERRRPQRGSPAARGSAPLHIAREAGRAALVVDRADALRLE